MAELDRKLTHLDEQGHPRMVDVTEKDESWRRAVARGEILMSAEALEAIRSGQTPKGEVLQVARIAGIQAGKRTGELIPLCHLLPGASIAVDLTVDPNLPGVRVEARATIAAQTGVEMEALTAASVALLTVYDMVKAMDRGMVIQGVRLVAKAGGRSGDWKAPAG
jgi:cyclic pyranopterin phosphate synthase